MIFLLKIFLFNNKKDLFKLNNNRNLSIYTKTILIGLGVINTPELLMKSKIIKRSKIYISDHRMYRVPLLNISKILEILKKRSFKSAKNIKDIISLRKAFIFKVFGRSLFIGLYYFQIIFLKI